MHLFYLVLKSILYCTVVSQLVDLILIIVLNASGTLATRCIRYNNVCYLSKRIQRIAKVPETI